MDRYPSIRRNAALRFAEILRADGRRLHVGCVMAAGEDWVEVSLPEHFLLEDEVLVRFPPSLHGHTVSPQWRTLDRVGFTYVAGGPPREQYAGFGGLLDPRPAALMLRRAAALAPVRAAS